MGDSNVRVRPYRTADAPAAGVVIAETFATFNLSEFSETERNALLGPFQHGRSTAPQHRAAIEQALRAEQVLVAELEGRLVGVLRGRHDKLQSLFVSGAAHRRGVGTALVRAFEAACRRRGPTVIRLQATLFAVPFYQHLGYRKTTGVRRMRIFEGSGYPYQPMKKSLPDASG